MVTYMEGQANKYRYERKFLIEKNKLSSFLRSIISKGFFEIYNERKINNIYLDNFLSDSVYENIEGLSKRNKYRIRWYGEKFDLSQKTLEIKIKNEFLNKKEKINISRSKLDDYSEINNHVVCLKKRLLEKNKSFYLKIFNLNPSLLNSYRRRYFYSSFFNIRLTIDNNLKFYSPVTKAHYLEQKIIIEVKYDKEIEFINEFDNLQLSRYSKYVKGYISTYFSKNVY